LRLCNSKTRRDWTAKCVFSFQQSLHFAQLKQSGHGHTVLGKRCFDGKMSTSRRALCSQNQKADGKGGSGWDWFGDRAVALVLGTGGFFLAWHSINEQLQERQQESWEVLEATLINCNVEDVSGSFSRPGVRSNVTLKYEFVDKAGDVHHGEQLAVLSKQDARRLQMLCAAGEKLPVRWEGKQTGKHKLIGDWGACTACTTVRAAVGLLLAGYALWIWP